MSSSTLAAGLRHLRGKLAAQQCREDSDEHLLHAFLSRRDDSAFAVLVRRHGPMVLHVCRRVLGHVQDAEDAFQATFLVLARNAASLRNKTSLASFLYGTAYRIAMKAKQAAARRRKHEGQTPPRPPLSPADELSWREVRTLLDEEIARLPEIYRSVFVLCYLEGLSRAESARRLGLKECTVWSRLAEARKRLSRRLARRGVELTALLGTVALATPPASALPVGLMASTIKAAMTTAAGKGLAGVVTASVAALVENSSPILGLSKAKLAMLLLAASLLGSGGALVHFQSDAAQSGGPPAIEKARPAASSQPAAKDKDKDAVTFAGRVLDPDDKPLAGARVYLIYYTWRAISVPVRASSDAEGRFHFRVAQADFDAALFPAPWERANVLAAARGYGPGLVQLKPGKPPARTELTLRLVRDDVPLTGRILDLQGRPVAGVSVHIRGLHAPVKGDLTAFVNALKEKKELHQPMFEHLHGLEGGWMGRDVSTLFAPVKTGADGRFTIKGVGRERLVRLRIEGPTIATRDVYAMTRPGETIPVAYSRGVLPNRERLIVHGSGFEYVAAPCKPIVGVVRDKDTGKPIPGAVVTSFKRAGVGLANQISAEGNPLRTVTDKDGRYRLNGMPKGQGNIIRAGPPAGEPYLMAAKAVADTPGLEPVTVDFALQRGLWLSGRVLDKVTHKPVRAEVDYRVFEDNTRGADPREGLSVDHLHTAADGTFRIVAVRDRGLLAVRARIGRYREAVGANQIKGLQKDGRFPTYPIFVVARHFHTLTEVRPAKDAKEVRCDILLDPGHILKGEVRGPDGEPLAGVWASGLRCYGGSAQWEHEPLKTSAFTVTAIEPGQVRLLEFAHLEKKLAGYLVLKGDEKDPLTVKLGPAGTLMGRLVTPDGKPVTEGTLITTDLPRDQPESARKKPTTGTLPPVQLGKDGRFRIEGLVPGLTYKLGLAKGMYLHDLGGAAEGKLSFKPGETKDLGDIKVKPLE